MSMQAQAQIQAPATFPRSPDPTSVYGGWFPARHVTLAAELAATVRDYGPDTVARVLDRVPDDQWREFALTLAAMVDPDRTPSQLLAWTTTGPVPSRSTDEPFPPVRKRVPRAPGEPVPSRRRVTCPSPGCGTSLRADKMRRHLEVKHPDDAEQAA